MEMIPQITWKMEVLAFTIRFEENAFNFFLTRLNLIDYSIKNIYITKTAPPFFVS